MDKTATFVSRNGPEFEEKIRQNEISNPKFNFLAPTDPYHSYYQHKLRELKEGKSAQAQPAAPTPQHQEAKDAKEANVQANLQKLNISAKTQDTQSRLIEQMIVLKGNFSLHFSNVKNQMSSLWTSSFADFCLFFKF